jgi:hypothetical protein
VCVGYCATILFGCCSEWNLLSRRCSWCQSQQQGAGQVQLCVCCTPVQTQQTQAVFRADSWQLLLCACCGLPSLGANPPHHPVSAPRVLPAAARSPRCLVFIKEHFGHRGYIAEETIKLLLEHGRLRCRNDAQSPGPAAVCSVFGSTFSWMSAVTE